MKEGHPDGHQEAGLRAEKDKESQRKDDARYLRNHRLTRHLINTLSRLILYANLLPSMYGKGLLRDPELRRIVFEREARTGLLEDSILSNELYFPNEEGTSLRHRVAVAGRWIAYDFNRPNEFGQKGKNRQMREGKLWAFPLDKIIFKNRGDYTPTDLLNILDAQHFLQLESPSIEELLNYGLAEEVTYKQAYGKVGLWEKYKDFLLLAGLTDNTVLTISPKGNGLVFIERDSGEKKKEPKAQAELKPAFGI